MALSGEINTGSIPAARNASSYGCESSARQCTGEPQTARTCFIYFEGTKSKTPLNQSGRPTLPGNLALLLRNRFHILHIGAGLREHMVEIVAEADERESLVEEFADARGSEQEQAQDHVVLLRRGAKFFR